MQNAGPAVEDDGEVDETDELLMALKRTSCEDFDTFPLKSFRIMTSPRGERTINCEIIVV